MASAVIRIGVRPLLCAAQDEVRAEASALLALEVLKVVDQHDPVAGGDAEHREEADQRAQRQDAAAQPGGERAADERDRQRDEGQRRQAPAPNAACSSRKIAIAAPMP